MDFQSWLYNPFNIIRMITMKTNDEKIDLNLNPNINIKMKTNHKRLKIRIQNVQNKSVKKFHWNKIWKHKHKKEQTKLWNKIVLQIDIEQTKYSGRFNIFLYPFRDLVHENFYEGFHMPTNQGTSLRTFQNAIELWIN